MCRPCPPETPACPHAFRHCAPICSAGSPDFVVLFASTGTDENGRNLLSCFLVDLHQKGVEVAKGYECVSHRGYVNNVINFKTL